MHEATEIAIQPLHRGRQTKFTPERIRQIANLLERGKSREEIAEILGVTVGTLQVTCSRLGISLRRPIFNTGTGLLRRRPTQHNGVGVSDAMPGNNDRELGTSSEQPEQAPSISPQQIPNSQPLGQVEHIPPQPQPKTHADSPARASFAIRMQYKGEERITELPIDHDMIRQLALEAELRDTRIGELIADLILAILQKDLLKLALEPTKSRSAPCEIKRP